MRMLAVGMQTAIHAEAHIYVAIKLHPQQDVLDSLDSLF